MTSSKHPKGPQDREDGLGADDQLQQIGARKRRLPLVDPHLARLPQQIDRRLG